MIEFARLGPKSYSDIPEDNSEIKKAKDTKKCLIKRNPKFCGINHKYFSSDYMEYKINGDRNKTL